MKFTKEEIETAKKVLRDYNQFDNGDVQKYLDSLLKPERKFINVRIEYSEWDCCKSEITAKTLETLLKTTSEYIGSNVKVTELSEVFTREDMIQFGEYSKANYNILDTENLKFFLSERKSK